MRVRRHVAAATIFVPLALVPRATVCQSATFASLANSSGLTVRRFDIDRTHSAVEFSVRFMGLSTVRGAFAEFGGTIMYDTANVTNSSVAVVIATASINTNSAMRDKDLKSENFFHAEKYPTITFHSVKVERSGGGFIAHGPLAMHGVTKDVAVPFKQTHGLEKDAWGNLRIGFIGELTLNRKDFGVLGTKFWNSEYDPGRMSVSDDVRIDLNVQGELNNVERWTTPKGDSLLKVAAEKGVGPMLAEFRAAAADTTSPARKFGEQMLDAAGTKLMHRKQFADAAEVYKLILEFTPESARMHTALGEAYLMAGKRELAERSLMRGAQLDADNTVAAEYLRRLRPGGGRAGGGP